MQVKWTGGSDYFGDPPTSILLYGPGATTQTEFPLDEAVEVSEAFAQILVGRPDFEAVDFTTITIESFGQATVNEIPGEKIMVIGAGGAGQVIDNPENTTLEVIVVALPSGIVGQVYDGSFDTIGGDGTAVVFAISDGDLPTGLEMDEDGVITGTPTVAGAFTFTVEATQSGSPATKEFSINVVDPAAVQVVSLLLFDEEVSTAGGAVTGDTVAKPAGMVGSFDVVMTMIPGGTPPDTPLSVLFQDADEDVDGSFGTVTSLGEGGGNGAASADLEAFIRVKATVAGAGASARFIAWLVYATPLE